MRIAVVGAGIFGCTAAVELAAQEHDVTLFERQFGILGGGSGNSCGRIHRGYHYPRSEATARATMTAAPQFTREFGPAIHTGAVHRYRIAEGSQVTREDYAGFLNRMGLPYRLDGRDFVVPETLVYVPMLRTLLRRRMRNTGVRVKLGQHGEPDMDGYDLTVLATYGTHTNRPLQYEVVETCIVRLPGLQDQSWVVLDGPYCCVDPLPGTDLHLLYDVTHSVHASNTGYAAEVPERLERLIDAGPVFTRQTHFPLMLDTARTHLPVRDAEYHGSQFTVRAVLPDVDDTDERPTLVERHGNTVWILAGKIDTCLDAADRLARTIPQEVPA